MSSRISSRVGAHPAAEFSISRLSRIPTASNTGTAAPRTQIPKAVPLNSKSGRGVSASESAESGLNAQSVDPKMPTGPPHTLVLDVPPLPRTAYSSSNNKVTVQSQLASPALTSSVSQKPTLSRKPPSIERYVERSKSRLPSLKRLPGIEKGNTEGFSKSSTKTHIQQAQTQPPVTPVETRIDTNPPVIPEFSGLSTSIGPLHLPPPTSNFTSSPSTRCSDSPGPWSSRTSTPTSLSSYSPGLTHPSKIGSRLRQPSPSLFRVHPTPYHVSGASYPGATKDAPSFPKSPQRAQTEPAQITGSKLPTKHHLQPANKVKTEALRCPSPSPTPASKGPVPKPYSKVDVATYRQENMNAEARNKYLQKVSKVEDVRIPPSKPPARPTRTGTEGLGLQSSPVIHSNLSSSKLAGHKRQDSAEGGFRFKAVGNAVSRDMSTDSLQPKTSSRIPHLSPSPNTFDRTDSRSPTPRHSSRSVSRKRSVLVKEPKEKDVKAEATDSGGRRFGFFSKKSRASPETSRLEQADRQARRGPAAGTGHEGYGRYAQRGRRTSIGSNASRAGSTSTNGSLGIASRTHADIDDFLLDRLEPVIITGGGMDCANLTRTRSEQSIGVLSVASTASSSTPRQSTKFYGQFPESLLSSTGRLVHSPEPMSAISTTSLSTAQGDYNSKSTTEKRLSFRKRSFFSKGNTNEPLSIPPEVSRLAPPIDVPNAHRSSMSQPDVSSLAKEDEGKDIKVLKKLQKPGKWNFFQRSHQLRRKDHFTETDLASITKIPVSVSNIPASRTVPHYALLDSDSVESDALENILNHIEESPQSEEEFHNISAKMDLKRQQSVLLPAPPVGLTEYTSDRRPSSPRVFFDKDVSTVMPETMPKSSGSTRLKSVGRIPAVVPRGNRQHKPPPQSFSRPFSRADMPSIAARSDVKPSTPHHNMSFSSMPAPVPQPAVCETLDTSKFSSLPGIGYSQGLPTTYPEFLVLSPRKNSEISETSTESLKSLKAITAIMPIPGSKLTEDEVWDEYDDFIDKVLISPPQEVKGIYSPRNSFRMATRASKALQAGLNAATMNSRLSYQSDCSSASTQTSVHLSRSMILSGLHSSSIAPSTPVSLGELYSDYAESDKSVIDSAILDVPPLGASKCVQASGGDKAQTKELDRRKNAALLDLTERERLGALAQANLRSGSLMTSRWLSFGRVLFSPAQNHVRTEDQSRILVIDGLGNDDWSFYCSLTYPKATVYNLSVLPCGPTSSNPAAWDPPANHRSVHHANFENPFPFPKGFFTVAILRFPGACSEVGLKNAIFECKRVLRTGGYLEMSILDLDMVNMGSRTRKAVRNLKERMFSADSSVSLKLASDNIQRLLGKRGFQNLNRCTVVVPVAGTIMKSSDTSNSSRSTAPNSMDTPNDSLPPRSASTISESQSRIRPPSDDVNVSLGDLLSDPSPSAANDEDIAKMVAKVGRWWYTRCYETSVLPEGNLDGSIWADHRLLRECQRRGTGFKLLIAYAQKPSEVTRRTVSV
ncbi:hypothetical protein D8B26_003975 [Coccidioides posadasii str. Silveira]|uniref:uncharacterized protein n=1 Tax=Coccidioides posadasii (strain RMSCC 757 / Silveira) TaxID=443226 RepID=UPI001BF111A8|nr:hypothetical protein D8B26_003975 [Coccidioides posadasii str. Silveira]